MTGREGLPRPRSAAQGGRGRHPVPPQSQNVFASQRESRDAGRTPSCWYGRRGSRLSASFLRHGDVAGRGGGGGASEQPVSGGGPTPPGEPGPAKSPVCGLPAAEEGDGGLRRVPPPPLPRGRKGWLRTPGGFPRGLLLRATPGPALWHREVPVPLSACCSPGPLVPGGEMLPATLSPGELPGLRHVPRWVRAVWHLRLLVREKGSVVFTAPRP